MIIVTILRQAGTRVPFILFSLATATTQRCLGVYTVVILTAK